MPPFTFCEAHSPRMLSIVKISLAAENPLWPNPGAEELRLVLPVAPGPAQDQGLTSGHGHTVLCPLTPELWGSPVPKMDYLAILKWIIQ